jgi:multidrug efflux pump subunit AcrA (membrane-fusion protein)
MSEIKINDESYSELGTERKNQDNWAAMYFEKLLSEHKAITSEQCSKAIADSETAVTTSEAAQQDSQDAKRQAETAVQAAESAKADSENAKSASEAAQEAAEAAQAITAEARAIAAGASADVAVVDAKVGDLSKANDGYFPSNVVEYVNKVEKNLLSVSEHCQQGTADVAAAKADKTSLSKTDAELARVRDEVIPTKADKTYVDDELPKKQDKELVWKKVETFTLTEDIDALEYTLPDNCYGVIAQVQVPKAVSYGGNGYLYIQQSGGWVGAVYSGALSSTNNEKEIRLVAYPQNGYYQSYGVIKNGSNNTTFTRFEPSTTQFMSTKANKTLVSVKNQSKMYTGSIITIWGLIKE